MRNLIATYLEEFALIASESLTLLEIIEYFNKTLQFSVCGFLAILKLVIYLNHPLIIEVVVTFFFLVIGGSALDLL